MGADLADLVFLNELQRIPDCVLVQGNLVISLRIHESIQIAVIVQILHIPSVNAGLGTFLSRAERLFNDTAALDVL